jgi:hypothetical protein
MRAIELRELVLIEIRVRPDGALDIDAHVTLGRSRC